MNKILDLIENLNWKRDFPFQKLQLQFFLSKFSFCGYVFINSTYKIQYSCLHLCHSNGCKSSNVEKKVTFMNFIRSNCNLWLNFKFVERKTSAVVLKSCHMTKITMMRINEIKWHTRQHNTVNIGSTRDIHSLLLQNS